MTTQLPVTTMGGPMRRLPLPRAALKLLLLLAGVAAASLLAGVAHAYWTSSGTGSGSGGTGSFDPPTSVSATAPADSASVAVSWSATLGPNGAAVTGYYVQRYDGGTPSAACSSSPTTLLSAPTTACDDVGVPNGTYTYAVTAVVGSWTARSEPSVATSVDVITFQVTAPSTTTAGFALTVSLTARDGSGAQVSDYAGTVHFTSTDPGSPVLPPDYTFSPTDNGTMTFTNGVELRTGPSQSITVREDLRPARTGTANVTVTPASSAQVGFTVQPGGGTGGVAWSTQPKVAIQDAYGNTVSTGGSVTLSIASGTSGAVLTCTNNPRTVTAGVATFAGCKIDKTGSYTLTATSASLATDTSSSFAVDVGTATKLGYAVQPSAVVAGAVLSPPVTVAVQDAGGNTVTSSSATIDLAFGANPGGATLDGTISVDVVDGEATFEDLSTTKSANGYTLSATSAGLSTATSTTFNVTAGVATQVGFTVQPPGGPGGVVWTPQPKVAIQDVYGNTVTGTASVTLSVATGTSGAVLTCTTNPRSVTSGVANFAGCKIDKSGTYTLLATSGSLATDVSESFTVDVGTATKLGYRVQPTTVVAGAVISPAVTVAVQDAGGNTVTSSAATVNLGFGANPGGAALGGTLSVDVVDGEATFDDLSITKSANSYSLSATSAGLTTATSSLFNVTTSGAVQVGFTAQPGGGTGGVVWTTQPKVAIQDAYGNTVSSTANVTLSVASGTGGAVLACTANPKAAVAGLATFAACKIDKAGSYTLTASSGTLATDTSGTFTVAVGGATKLVYTVQPSSVVAGAAISPAVTVAVQDAGGNTVASSAAVVNLAIGTNPGAGTLSGTLSRVVVGGEAVFDDVWINKVGTGYTLSSTSTGLTAATSSTFNVVVGAAAQVGFTTQPGGGTGGVAWGVQPKVAIQDAYSNTVTSSTASVTLSVASGTAGAILTCTTNPVTAVAGVATFAGCKIDKSGSYTLTATSATLATDTSTGFTIAVGVAAKLGYSAQPSAVVAGVAISPAVAVAVQDAGGNTVTTSSVTVTTAIGTNPGGGTLSGTLSVAASSGVATFSNLSINKTATGYTLNTTSTGLTASISSTFNVTPGAASKLAVTVQPTNVVAGASITPTVTVAVQDANSNTVTTSSATVTMAIGTNPGGGTLSGTTSVAASSGVATFSTLSINRTGTGYTLGATSAGLTSATSSTFNVTVGVAAQVAFTVEPGGGTGGVVWTTQPRVAVQDANGNTVSSTASVTLSIASGTSGAVLACTTNPLAAVAGVATFAGCKIDKSGSYTLTAASGVLTADTSAAFTVAVGAATKLVYTVQPSSVVAGAAISPAVTVAVQDAGSNTVTTSAAVVNLAIGTNPAAGTLSGTLSRVVIGGEAVFDDVWINRNGNGYTLSATSTGLTTSVSTTFNVVVGGAAQVGFTTQPGGGTATIAWTTQPKAAIQDSQGNTITSSTASVTLSIATGTGGALLTCTTNPVAAVAGVATFAGCKIDKSGSYTLSAASTGLTSGTSASLNIAVGTATKLGYSVQPSTVVAGAVISPSVAVLVQDAGGNTVTTSSANVTIAILTNPGVGTLTGTLTVAASSGVATFSNLSINKTGTGYTLNTTSTGLTASISTTFNVTPGAASKLGFTTQPTNVVAGASISPSVTVAVQDANSNTVTTSSATVTMAIGTNPGGGTLSGTLSVVASSGVATFSNLWIDKTGTGYTLAATSTGLTGATSGTFNVTVGAAAQVAFTVEPSGGTGGVVWTTQPKVAVQDAYGNATTSTASVTLSIASGTGGAVLACTTNPLAAVAGVATFAGCKIDKSGSYTLTAASGVLTADTSAAFTIAVGPATKLGYSVQPSTVVAGVVISPSVAVAVQDAGGNTVTTSGVTVTVAILANPGTGTLSGTLSGAASSGVATFSNLSINKTGTGYTLNATSTGLTAAVSTTFNVAPGTASKLGFTTQPAAVVAGVSISPAVAVAVQDTNGNTVTSSSATVTVAIGTNPGSGTLSGATSVAASSGVATFSNLSINKTGTGYTLTAASASLTGATSSTFNVTAAVAAQLAFSVQPGGGTGGTAWTTQPKVLVQDAFGNTTTSTTSVTLGLASGTAGAILTCTTNPVAAVAGTATFAGCRIDKTGSYTLSAAATGLTGATSNSLTVTVGAAAKLAFSVQPSDGTAGAVWTSQPQVLVQDAGGNTVTTSSLSITLAITAGTGTTGALLTCTTNPLAATSGIATFSGCKINLAGTGYTLRASTGALTIATSNPFNIT